jgi:group I intron endonuclease
MKENLPKSMKGVSGVYRIVCTQNGKFYVGESFDVGARFEAHLCALKKGRHFNPSLQNDFKEFGVDCFELELLEAVEKGMDMERKAKETQWIERLGANKGEGYNKAPGRKYFDRQFNLEKEKYSEKEALNEVFSNASAATMGKAKYDRIMIYRGRHERGKLGQKAIETILSEYGFERENWYERKE